MDLLSSCTPQDSRTALFLQTIITMFRKYSKIIMSAPQGDGVRDSDSRRDGACRRKFNIACEDTSTNFLRGKGFGQGFHPIL